MGKVDPLPAPFGLDTKPCQAPDKGLLRRDLKSLPILDDRIRVRPSEGQSQKLCTTARIHDDVARALLIIRIKNRCLGTQGNGQDRTQFHRHVKVPAKAQRSGVTRYEYGLLKDQ
jgi:hypothetical protein